MDIKTINLHLFEEIQKTDTATLSVEMKTFYDTALIRLAKPKLLHDQFGKKQKIPKNRGKKIEWRTFTSLPKATTPITEGVTPDGSKIDASAIEATVSQYGDFIKYSDLLSMTTIDPIVSEYAYALSAQAGLTKDTLTRNELLTGTNVIYADKVGADGTVTPVKSRAELDGTAKLSVKTLYKAAAVLKAQNTPTINGSYVAIIHPYAKNDLMAEAKENWIDIAKYGEHIKDIIDGEVGKIGNIRIVESSEAKVYAKGQDSCPNSIFCTLVLGDGAYGTVDIEGGGLEMIVKQLGAGDDPLNQRATIGWKMTHVAKILVQQYMVRIESCSTQFADVPAN